MASWERIALRAEERVDELRKENEQLKAGLEEFYMFLCERAVIDDIIRTPDDAEYYVKEYLTYKKQDK